MIDFDPDPPFPRWECAICEKGIGYTDAIPGVDWVWSEIPGRSGSPQRICLVCESDLDIQAGAGHAPGR